MTILNRAKPIVYFSADDNNTTIPTRVVLQFRCTKWENLPLGNDITCSQYVIDKVIYTRDKRGIKQVLVKWKGFSSEFDSWIPEICVHEYGNPSQSVLCDAVQ